MSNNESGEKTEDPTPKKLRDARRDGTVAKSAELSAWGAILIVSVVAGPLVGNLARRFEQVTRSSSEVASTFARDGADAEAVWRYTLDAAWQVVMVAGVLWAVTSVVGVAIGVAQTKGLVAPKLLKPKLKKLSPKEGIKRIVGTQALWEFAKQLLKLLGLAAASWPRLTDFADRYASGAMHAPLELAAQAGAMCVYITRDLAAIALVVGGADYAWNKRKTTKQLRMTRQQVRDEFKNAEGDPHMKAQRRARAAAISRNRMIAAAGDASVVVVNPTHVAVALKYTSGQGPPKVVARGGGHLAARIRMAAADAGVPVVRDVPLARTLYAVCRSGESIPAELFGAIAKTLAFVMAAPPAFGGPLRPRQSALGGDPDVRPPGPDPSRRAYQRSRRTKDGRPAGS